MQDRFRFRAWQMRYWGKQMPNEPYGLMNYFNISENLKNKDINFEKDQIMQCTGLKDKNGKLIYEGDIIKNLNYFNKIYICTFLPIFGGLGLISKQDLNDYNFCKKNWFEYSINSEIRRLDNRFKLANYGNKLKCFSMTKLIMEDLEIIGNIYENPELLN